MDTISEDGGYRVFVRKPIPESQTENFPIEEGFDVNLGVLSSIRLNMGEYERISPEDGGDCASDSYLLQRFDQTIFTVTNETIYTKEVVAFTCNALIILQNIRSWPLSILLDMSGILRCRSNAP